MSKSEQIRAPFTPPQVEALNHWQRSGWHPFTCGSKITCHETVEVQENQKLGVPAAKFEASTTLVATEQGWKCPKCAYVQDWAWSFMMNGSLMDSKGDKIGDPSLVPTTLVPS